ncbi:Glycerol acyltransferase [Sphingomonas sp. EC-HK361]|uniref:lysophospholipid acyltransferase family protein n=1 Tax=Sphingomonas sp. EC-HK361 TaxID=2038397 RepID=UPI0012596713|nr:1-acyl-sn-glycerol-3-phosphate acyltransferase [Sphingomonas sp. EC-HK361]VVS98023.1 Glycerol acyltransferase [Sphingomonas sp. EC-HK361]
MDGAIAWVRTLAFRIVFYGLSVPIVGTVPISALFGQKAIIAHATFWTRFHRWAARWLLGIRIRIEGERPEGPALYASKHQAMFETLELQALLDGPAMVLKQELADIPVWGWAARRYGALVIDRDASATALRQMMREGKAAKAQGRSVLIFPEGTRVRPGEQPPLKSGFAGLYRTLGMPTVPVACDTGVLWPKKGAKHAGVITFRFGDVIPPGLPREEIDARVHAAINVLDR